MSTEPRGNRPIRVGTRKSRLALWQTEHVASLLKRSFPELVLKTLRLDTKGDRSQATGISLPEIGGKGLFTKELERALLDSSVDIAVHSLKDLPTELDSAFVLGAICKRARAEDVLISRSGCSLDGLSAGSTIGTSSLRRSAQLKYIRPDLRFENIRGNVETRIRKLRDPSLPYDAILLAAAGVMRLGLEGDITEILPSDVMLPAPGQGAIAVQCRADDGETLEVLASIHDEATLIEVTAERAFLSALGGGCNMPIAARAILGDGDLDFQGACLSADGKRKIAVSGFSEPDVASADELGRKMASLAIEKGFYDL